jgi:hypothetical protein
MFSGPLGSVVANTLPIGQVRRAGDDVDEALDGELATWATVVS